MDAKFIAAVMETPLGTMSRWHDTPEITKERKKITNRYEKLKWKMDWSEASLQARAEWLEKHLAKGKKHVARRTTDKTRGRRKNTAATKSRRKS
jgi:hypothetical protein